MSFQPKCPGADGRGIKAELQTCPQCGYSVEIFSDENIVRCPKCKAPVTRQKNMSCRDWCKFWEKCFPEKKKEQK